MNANGKKEHLKTLKTASNIAFRKALQEVDEMIAQYEEKIKTVQNAPYVGYSTSSEAMENVKYAKTRIMAEIRILPENKEVIIENALTTKVSSQALLELIQSNELDSSYWTEDIFKKAYLNSKSQKEIDWEINKQNQIDNLRQEASDKYNYGSYLGALKILNGDVVNRVPSLDQLFNDEISSIEKEQSRFNE